MDGNDQDHDRWMDKITNALRSFRQANLRETENMRALRSVTGSGGSGEGTAVRNPHALGR